MSETYAGGCACGAIRYEIDAEPLLMSDDPTLPKFDRMPPG